MKKLICFTLSIFLISFLHAQTLIVKDIQSQSGKGNKIIVQWENPEDSENTIKSFRIYRTQNQITSYSQIKGLEPVAEISGELSGYTDTVNDFNDYYYTVISVTTAPVQIVLLSYNSTVRGVRLKEQIKQPPVQKVSESEKLYPEGSMRETPLPPIDMTGEIDVQELQFSGLAELKKDSLIKRTKESAPLLSPYIFEEDLISPEGGDDFLLFNILKNYFVQKKYEEAITQFQRLAGTNINEQTRNRTYFYLGQAQYMTGQYENAVRTFVRLEDVYPVLIKKWLNSSLEHL